MTDPDLEFTLPAGEDDPWQDESLGELDYLPRHLVVLRPKRAYQEWIGRYDAYELKRTLSDLREADSVSFLVPLHMNLGHTREFVQEHWRHFFAQMLNLWNDDRKQWPPKRTQQMFEQWFDIEYCDGTIDLGNYAEEP